MERGLVKFRKGWVFFKKVGNYLIYKNVLKIIKDSFVMKILINC